MNVIKKQEEANPALRTYEVRCSTGHICTIIAGVDHYIYSNPGITSWEMTAILDMLGLAEKQGHAVSPLDAEIFLLLAR